jgi:EAL domain-containing protein (putative c-di-GMP-specific phosphodiesterase class I)
MGKSLRMQIIAEGVESREQLRFLQEHGCPQVQGFYFSRRLPAEQFQQLLKSGALALAAA